MGVLRVRILVTIEGEQWVTAQLDQDEYDAWRGEKEDTAALRSKFIRADRHFTPYSLVWPPEEEDNIRDWSFGEPVVTSHAQIPPA